MKILVTGSQGFVGKKLVQALKKKKYSVKEFDLVQGNDLLKKEDCLKATKGINVIIHLAAELEEKSPVLWKVNVDGTKNLADAAVENRVERFIFTSSVGVYGNCKERVDEHSEFAPVNDYEKSKVEAEKVLEEFQEEIVVTILRPAIVLGENKYWEKNIKVVKKGFPLPMNGQNKWQTIYVDDLVNAIIFAIEHEETEGDAYIVAEENAFTLKELILEIKKNLEMKEKVTTLPRIIGVPLFYLYITVSGFFGKKIGFEKEHINRLCRSRWYDISKIKSLGWTPEFDMKKAVEKTVKELKMN